MITLGLDIGSNSVGSAWVDTESCEIAQGVSVFPAGVEVSDTKRGNPKNQSRRQKRSQRRSIERRAKRKLRLRESLQITGLLPRGAQELTTLMNANPWHLRRKGLHEALTPHQFGRALVHLNQHRGALGVETDPEDTEEGVVKEAIDRTRKLIQERKAETFGQMMADLYDERQAATGNDAKKFCDTIRNRRDTFEFHADRMLIREEFELLWTQQKSFGGELAKLLTDDLRKTLDDPSGDKTWRHRGEIFGQRRTYWNTGTLGRCDLEPTDHRCPQADMYAQEFRVLETINNIRIEERGQSARALNEDERSKVLAVLREQKTASPATIRKALGIHTKAKKEFFGLNIERDEEREVNTDWFQREIIGAIGKDPWALLTDSQHEEINRAILKFDPEKDEHATRLRDGAIAWWSLSNESADKLVEAWKKRPKLEIRVNLSRRTIENLLPYLRQGLTITEARQHMAEDADSGATPEQRARYAFTITDVVRKRLIDEVGLKRAGQLLQLRGLTKKDRQYLDKHPNLLPPAPMLANPVVRKAIHEVRRHVIAYLRKFPGERPDRVVIELAREAKQSKLVRDRELSANRQREKERKQIVEQFDLDVLTENQKQKAITRVLLCRQQREVCPYSDLDAEMGRTITEEQAAAGRDLEIDHIIPESRGGGKMKGNSVLCYRESNRGKGNQTPKEWLTKEKFERLEQRFEPWKKEQTVKWNNLHADAPSIDEFSRSQLTDTAYAAVQVGEYLQNALWGADTAGKRRVFFTKGLYTAMLRNDWGLNETRLDCEWHGHADTSNEAEPERGPARKGKKDRSDHRHHAIDALVIALTDSGTVERVARTAEWQILEKERTGMTPRRRALDVPASWGSVEKLRAQALNCARALVVFHRPIKRKAKGYLHKEGMWGAVDEADGVFRFRCLTADLNAKMLRMPVEETDAQVKDRLTEFKLRFGLSGPEARKWAREAFKQGQYTRRMVDPPLGKGGLVRDWNLRRVIREILSNNGINPDDFTDKKMKEFVASGKLKMPNSGVPIKSVITIGPISDPIKIAVKDRSTGRQAINSRTGKPLFRYHISRNNHHVEIVQDDNSGEWSARNDQCVTMYEAAQRVRPRNNAAGAASAPRSAVDRTDCDRKKFVMSLSEGETIRAKRPGREENDTSAVGYYVVVKLDKSRIWFAPHWDARAADAQDRWDTSYPALKNCEPEPGKPPYKVRVSPLGEVTPLPHD